MRVRGRGGILNLASIGGYVPGPNQAVYYASKAYVLSLSEAIAAETAGQGVRVMRAGAGARQHQFHARMGARDALYRYFVPPASAQIAWRAPATAASRWAGASWCPGLLNPFLALAMRIMPHRIVIPIVGWLLKPRRRRPSDAGR